MQFGIFDHMDDAGVSIPQQFQDRLDLMSEFEKAGFVRYQVAEHHGTPLGYAPSPNLFLAAAAQRTTTLRLGALVNLLPLYNPLRLLEEICMLDNMTGGRLDLGMGPGASPVEMKLFNIENRDIAREMYVEAFALITKGLKTGELDFEGRYFRAERFPVVMPMVQKNVPLWYGTNSPDTMKWAASVKANVVSLGAVSVARALNERYREAWAELGASPADMPHTGLVRHIVVADTDDEALAIARRAYPRWRYHMNYLWEKRGTKFTLGSIFPETYEELEKIGHSAVGSPETVRRKLSEQLEEAGSTYLACQVVFGNMTPDESRRSIRLFGSEVMPALQAARLGQKSASQGATSKAAVG